MFLLIIAEVKKTIGSLTAILHTILPVATEYENPFSDIMKQNDNVLAAVSALQKSFFDLDKNLQGKM